MNYELITLGCKVNEYESNFYVQELERAGFSLSEGNSDLCIINTCTVTNKAAAKSRQMISRLKKKNPNALIVVIGCYVSFLESSKVSDMGIDLVIPVSSKEQFLSRIAQKLVEKDPSAYASLSQYVTQEPDRETEKSFQAMSVKHFSGQKRAFLKIQDGCNQFCTYCQIPLARGRERSWDVENILQTARQLYENGHREIVLTGIHTGRFMDGEKKLSDLIGILLENTPEDLYFRISSIEINEVDDQLIELIANNKRMLPHLHIPIQSGSDPTLQRMNRPYTIRQFEERLEEIRRRIPDISISTDVIAGFVDESQEEFEQTFQTLERLKFSFLHVFGYSRRSGTRADQMEGHLSPDVIRQRVGRLMQLSKDLRRQDMSRFTQSEVLIERLGKDGMYKGHTSNYHPVSISAPDQISGRVLVNLNTINEDGYTGEVYETVQDV